MYDYYLKKSNYFMNIINAEVTVSFSSSQFRGITYLKEVAENMEKVIELLGKKVRLEDSSPRHNLWMNCGKAKKYGVKFSTVIDGLLKCAKDNNIFTESCL